MAVPLRGPARRLRNLLTSNVGSTSEGSQWVVVALRSISSIDVEVSQRKNLRGEEETALPRASRSGEVLISSPLNSGQFTPLGSLVHGLQLRSVSKSQLPVAWLMIPQPQARSFSDAVAGAGYNGATPLPSSHTTRELREQTYARSFDEYFGVMRSLVESNRSFLLRDVYEDFIMDGYFPSRQVHHLLLTGSKRGKRLQDVMFFLEEMKSHGASVDIVAYNNVIEAFGLLGHADRALKYFDEMRARGITPRHKTYNLLIRACSVAGMVEKAHTYAQLMKDAGHELDAQSYRSLISVYSNAKPFKEEYKAKVLELLAEAIKNLQRDKTGGEKDLSEEESEEQGYSEGEGDKAVQGCSEVRGDKEVQGDNKVRGDKEVQGYSDERGDKEVQGYSEERGDKETGGFVLLAPLRAAVIAVTSWKDVEGAAKVQEMAKEAGIHMDGFCKTRLITAYLSVKAVEEAKAVYLDLVTDGHPGIDLQVAMILGAIKQYSPQGAEFVQEQLRDFKSRGRFLSSAHGESLLIAAAKEKGGDYGSAKAVFDLVMEGMKGRNVQRPSPYAVHLFADGLLTREVPEDDERLSLARAYLRTCNPNTYMYFDNTRPMNLRGN